MILELKKLFAKPVYWAIIVLSLGLRCILAFMDTLYRPHIFWDLTCSSWTYLGSLTLILIILLIPMGMFSQDVHYNTTPMILCTKNGRIPLYITRLIACCIFTTLTVILLTLSNIIIACVLKEFQWNPVMFCIKQSFQVILGGILLSIFSSLICDYFHSHMTAMIINGILCMIGFLIRGNLLGNSLSILSFFHKGFFTPLLRGQVFYSWQNHFIFWSMWTLFLIIIALIFDLKKRKERNEI